MTDLHVTVWGQGETAVLVHGDVSAGAETFRGQRVLGARWRLVTPDRRGFGDSPPARRQDFEADAHDVAALLGDGAHLVGHSYGGVVSLFAAALRPDAVRSLTVSEPPAFGLARGAPAVEALLAGLLPLFAQAETLSPDAFLSRFVAAVGGDPTRLPSPLPAGLVRHTRLLMTQRPPWEATIPLQALAAAPFPKLVVSGGHAGAFDAVCDVLAARLGAERAVVAGAGHSVPSTGAPFSRRIEAFWQTARTAGRGGPG